MKKLNLRWAVSLFIFIILILPCPGNGLEKGVEFYRAENFNEAEKVFSDLLNTSENELTLSQAYYYQGRIYYRRNGDFNKALLFYSNVSPSSSFYPAALYFSGIIYEESGYFSKARECFFKVTQIEGNDYERLAHIRLKMIINKKDEISEYLVLPDSESVKDDEKTNGDIIISQKPAIRREPQKAHQPSLKETPTVTTVTHPRAAPKTSGGNTNIFLELDSANITDFIRMIGNLLDINFIVDQNVTGRITIAGPKSIPKSKVFDVFVQILNAYNFDAVKLDGFYRITQSSASLHNVSASAAFVTNLYTPKNMRTNDLIPIINSMLKSPRVIQEFRDLNMILITGEKSSVRDALKILNQIDENAQNNFFNIYSVKHTSPQNLVNRLTNFVSTFLKLQNFILIPVEESGAVIIGAHRDNFNTIYKAAESFDMDSRLNLNINIVRLNHSEPEEISSKLNDLISINQDIVSGQVKIIADNLRKSLIISSTSRSLLSLIEKIALELDSPVSEKLSTLHIYKLRNTNSMRLARNLNELFAHDVEKRDVKFVADEQTNSIIITAEPQKYSEILNIIKTLDEAKSRVLVDVLIAEASMEKVMEIGVEWQAASKLGTNNYTFGAGTNYSLRPQLAAGALYGLNVGLTKTGGDVYGIINAFKDDKEFNVIATTHLLSNDNEPAEISVGDVIPLLSTSRITEQNSVIKSYTYEDVGVHLLIVPRINDHDYVTLDIQQTTSEVKSGGSLDAPTRSRRNIQTTVSIADGRTIVLGGAMGTRKLTTQKKVPFLGDLPGIIGQIFRSDFTREINTNLLIFITPHIIKSDYELEILTEQKRQTQDLNTGE